MKENKRRSKGSKDGNGQDSNDRKRARKAINRSTTDGNDMKGVETIHKVFELISNSHHRHVSYKLLEEWEQSGMVELTLWPLFSSSSKLELEEELLRRAAYVLAYLINYRSTSRSNATTGSPLSFLNNLEQDDSNVSIFLQNLLLSSSNNNNNNSDDVAKETTIVTFFIHALASLDRQAKWKNSLLEIFATIHLWKSMKNIRYRELELRKNAAYRRRWALAQKTSDKDHDDKSKPSDTFLANLLLKFLSLLKIHETTTKQNNRNQDTPSVETNTNKDDFDSSSTQESDVESKHDDDMEDANNNVETSNESNTSQRNLFAFFHQTLQLLIDLLSIAASRRYLRPYLLSINFTVHCALSSMPKSSTLFAQLLHMLQELEQFDFEDKRDDDTTKKTSSEMNAAKYHDRAHILQKLCHKRHQETCSDIIFAGVGMICQRPFLESKLRLLDFDILKDLAFRLRLIPDKDDINHEKKVITEILLYHHVLPRSSLEMLKTLPLYPSEKLLWDQHQLPPSLSRSKTLALPKLNCQFLTFVDYLLRNFSLVRLESAYGIRSDICDAVSRMKPVAVQSYQPIAMDVDDIDLFEAQNWKNHTRFQGWARMALELHKPVELVQVSPAHLGELIPHSVVAEFAIDLYHCGDSISDEWDSLQEFDNLFLVSVQAPKMNQNILTSDHDMSFSSEEDPSFPTRFGVTAVRGCMVLEIRDEGGNVLTDYSQQKSENTETLRKGNKRYFRVALDPAQYALDLMLY